MQFGTSLVRVRPLFERLTDRLLDPSRRDRSVLVLICGYVAAWTLYGVLAKGSQGIHFDMAEIADWAQHPVGGYYKHPPLTAWITAAWFEVLPRADWAYYLLTMSGVGIALWAAWRLFGLWLDGEKRVLALALLSLMPLLSFHALKYNHNTQLIPLWALTTLWFVRSYEQRRLADAALAGLVAGACMMTKYYSVFLIAGLGLAALLGPYRRDYFRSAAPWVSAVVGLAVLMPHLVWLVQNKFPTFGYAMTVHGGRRLGTSLAEIADYLGALVGYAALPVIVALLAVRPSRDALADMVRPGDARPRWVAIAFWVPLLLPIAVALFSGTAIVGVWTMPAWTLLPVLLLWSPRVVVSRRAVADALGLATVFPLVMVLAAPVIAWSIHRAADPGPNVFYQPVAEATQKAWRAVTKEPLRYVGGDGNLVFGAAFYMPDRPSAFPDLNRVVAPWIAPGIVSRDGIALVCPMEEIGCVARMRGIASRRTGSVVQELDLAGRYLGQNGVAERFLIIVVPPDNKPA